MADEKKTADTADPAKPTPPEQATPAVDPWAVIEKEFNTIFPSKASLKRVIAALKLL